MTIESEHDLNGMKRIGRIVGLAREAMVRQVKDGMTTQALDDIATAVLSKHGARPAPKLAYDFPGTACISINDEAAHSIPSSRIIQRGDLVNIDVSAELDGFYADTAVTIPISPISPQQRKLLNCAKKAMRAGIAAARTGQPINAIGRATEQVAHRCGFNIIQQLTGHGVGRNIHESPDVPSFYVKWLNQPLQEGQVITIEPFLSAGPDFVVEDDDGWTLRSPDGSLNAQFEHTIVVQQGKAMVLTAV